MSKYEFNSRLEKVINTLYGNQEDKSIEAFEEHADVEYLIDALQMTDY